MACECVRHPRLPNPWVSFHSLCLTSYSHQKHVQHCILNLHAHQHTSKHTTWHQSSQNPSMQSIIATHFKLSMHLSCISCYLIQGNKQTRYPKAKKQASARYQYQLRPKYVGIVSKHQASIFIMFIIKMHVHVNA